ncbi:MAG: peptidase M35, partial [Anaerolineaceae bacterium]
MKKLRLQVAILITFLAALLFIAGTVVAAPADNPVVSLSAAQSEYTASQDVLITVTISNPTRHALRILKWFTPVDGIEEPVFGVRLDGTQVSYTGAIYKRPAATGNDYITLKPGES